MAVADFYPQFSLTGTLNYQNSLARDLFAGGSGIYSGGPQVNWPIFSGGSTISNLRLQKAATDAAYITYQKTVLAALSDVESYLVAFAKEWDHRKALSDAVVKNRRALRFIAATLPGGHDGVSDGAGRGTLLARVGDGAGPEPAGHFLGPGQHLPGAGRRVGGEDQPHSTVTLLARLRGLSMSQPRATAM